MAKKIICILLIVSLWQMAPAIITAQQTVQQPRRYISGRITDAEDGEPVPAVTVFFTNTTFGTTTDLEGNYRLRIPGEGSYSLTVSHVSYQTVIKETEPGIGSPVFDVALQIKELEGVDIAARIRSRQADINLFWRTVLGKNPSRRTIQATNPDAVYYYYNLETNILKVTCREPLQIVNYETGYQIQCVIDHFTHDYNTGITDWDVQCVFKELEAKNQRQKNNWAAKRKEVYNVSLTKFFKSLYNNSLLNDGFVLADILLANDLVNPFRFSLLTQDNLISTVSDYNSKTFDLSDHLTLLICYGRPVTDYDLAILERSQYEQREQFDRIGLYKSLLRSEKIHIFPDGSFSDRLSIASMDKTSSSSLMGFSKKLPLEYLPDGSTHLAVAAAAIEKANDFDEIAQHFDTQLSVFPQEKIHLHTDRDIYVPGEKIWFKAYVVDANTHLTMANSQYVYAELISPADTLVSRVMIRQTDDMYYGYLPIATHIPEGNYTLRAHTRYMENLGDDYFFKKNIRIAGNGGNRGSSVSRENTSPTSGGGGGTFDISFFPEGGNLPEGVLCKVAFKALNRDGTSAHITGYLIDESGVEISPVQTYHAGMGVFTYLPETGKRYRLKCSNENGLERLFDLPQPNPHAYSLATSKQNDKIMIGVLSPFGGGRGKVNIKTHTSNPPLYLLVHCRGAVLYFSELSDQKVVSFDKEALPSGVIQFVLFDSQMNPLSERLLFCKNEATIPIEFHTDKETYQIRDKIVSTLSLTPSLSGRVGERCLSVAVTDDKDVAVDESTTILSSLLLSSELKGYIENPACYLQDDIAMDLLMMSHGWRRYNVPEVIKGNPAYPKIPFQQSLQISGKVKGLFLRPVADSEVLIVTEQGTYGMTTTDDQGTFMFQDFEYPDSSSFMLQALSKRGSDRVAVVLDEELFPSPVHAPQSLFSRQKTIDTEIKDLETKETEIHDAFMVKAEQRTKYDEDMRVIHLSEIEVTAPRIDRKEERRLEFYGNRGSEYTIRRDIMDKVYYNHVAQYLTYAPGVQVRRDIDDIFDYVISIAGMRGAPLLLVDGVQVASLRDLSPDEVESIDIIKMVSASVFGVRGDGGVISITTGFGRESSEREKFNQTIHTPLGYQTLTFHSFT